MSHSHVPCNLSPVTCNIDQTFELCTVFFLLFCIWCFQNSFVFVAVTLTKKKLLEIWRFHFNWGRLEFTKIYQISMYKTACIRCSEGSKHPKTVLLIYLCHYNNIKKLLMTCDTWHIGDGEHCVTISGP